ncbi:hypothetical protein PSHT_06806 [Puccinia striiformis]|uniref:Uncharacterized protein n=1 Tax=Puccinia striiformis TaxID=27350 RepID=A0A2S4W364_9BASI|nr:hypothetical protein PSHT_06806 [Puccinia striiformis]
MSYASVLAENAPPVQDQPKPDPNLLEGQSTETHQNQEQERDEHHSDHSNDENHPSKKEEDEQVKEKPKKVNKEGKKKEQRPTCCPGGGAGAISLINVITLSATALFALKYWNKPTWDKRIVSSVIVGVSLIMGGQGYIVKLFPNLHKK